MKHFIDVYKWHISFLLTSVIFGSAIAYSQSLIALASLGVLYLCAKNLIGQHWPLYYFATTASLGLAFLSAIWWFTKITAQGWSSRIWIFPPNVWLAVLLIVVTLLAVALACLVHIGLWRFTKMHSYRKWMLPFAWSLAMLLTEVLISTSFSFFAQGNGVPTMPSWNFLSSALIIPADSIFGVILPVFGFWGSSYVVYLVVASTTELFGSLNTKQHQHVLGFTGVLLLTLIPISLHEYFVASKATDTVRITALATQQTNNQYLEKVISQAQKADTDNQHVIALPEYSALLSPYPQGVLSLDNEDFREDIKNISDDKNLYFVGTEDVYKNGGRHVETYVVNRQLEKLKTEQKIFLVPGGEYMVPWVAEVIRVVDPGSINQFYAERGRKVVPAISIPTKHDETAQKLAIGACSTVLTPYNFRSQVAQGAQLIVTNVSFTQFDNAPEYKNYAFRFGQFNARALERNLVSSSFAGQAYLLDKSGQKIIATDQGIISEKATMYSHQTLYARLGDTKIIFGIFLINIGAFTSYFIYRRYRQPD